MNDIIDNLADHPFVVFVFLIVGAYNVYTKLEKKKCPQCQSFIPKSAKKCPKCTSDIR